MKAFLFLFLLCLVDTALAQVQIGGAYYFPASSLVGAGNVVAIENRSSLPDGKVTINEKNICPKNYHGGTLYQISQFLQVFTNATTVNGEIYAQWPPVKPSGATEQHSGSTINTLGPPFPEYGQTVTFENVFTPALYFYSMTCYYNNGCPEEGPNVGLCEWNAPSYWIGINLGTNPPPPMDNFDLAVKLISVNSEIAADGKPSISPEKEFQVDVSISGSGFNNPENRNAMVTLQIGSQSFQKTIALSSISSGGTTVPFSLTLQADEVGDQTLTATIDPLNSLNETNRQNNTSSQLMHVLCKASDRGAEVPWFYQSQSPWGSQDYANQAPKKMKSLGCMVTSLAMLFKHYGIDMAADGAAMDPGSVNRGLNATPLFAELGPQYSSFSGYTPSGGVQAKGAVAFARNSYFMKCVRNNGNVESCVEESKNRVSFKHSSNSFSETSRKLINKELCNGNPVILKVPSISAPNDPVKAHFVLATGMTVDEDGNPQYFINNPANSGGKDERRSINSIKGYRLYRPTYDPSMVFFHLAGNVDMVVIDPQGRRFGYNPITQESFSEILGGTYFTAESISDPVDASIFTPPEVRFEGMAPVSGQYRVQIFAKSNTSYRLTKYSFDTTGTINGISDKKGTLDSGTSTVIEIEHSENIIPVRNASLKINKAIFFDTRHKDMAFISGQITPTDGHSISSIKKYLQIKIGYFTKAMDMHHLKKIKNHRQTIYFYGGIGKNDLFLKLNADTGDFDMVVRNFPLDSRDSSIITDVMIQADDVIAKGFVTFKTIRRNKGHDR